MHSQARAVVIGGGAVGCSALYHLARLGWTDCVLLERDELTAGSTWHAAGNCPNFSTNASIMKLQRASTRLYAQLAEETGQPVAYHITGSIRLAHTADRMDEFLHVAAMANAQDIAFAILTPAEIKARYELIETHDLLGGLFDPLDGDIDPSQLTHAFAKGARDLGARIMRGTRVTGLARTETGWRVQTTAGTITSGTIVNAAGYRAGEIMAQLGHYLPVVSIQHQYLVTETIPALVGCPAKLPLLRDPDTSWYLRQERGGLLLGPYEAHATPVWSDGIPDNFAAQLFPDDLARLAPQIEDAVARVPMLGRVGVRRVVNGPIPYTPDGNPLIGPAPGLPGFFHCCAFSFGIVQAGGAGKAVAEWVVHGEPEFDLWACDPRRFGAYATKTYALARAVETYRNEYAVAYPREERPAGRPVHTSPLYEVLRGKGAVFGARNGWETPLWFSRKGETDRPSFRRAVPGFAALARECHAARGCVGLAELPGLGKFMVEGPATAAWLDRILCDPLPPQGETAPNRLLSKHGGIVSAFAVTRLASDRFYLVTAAAAETHDHDELARLLPTDESARLSNVTTEHGTLLLIGPRAGNVLAQVTTRPLALPADIAGESAWELHVPMQDLPALYNALWRAGEPLGIIDIGLLALESLRLEAGLPCWQQELTRTPPPHASLVQLLLTDAGEADAPPNTPVWSDGERVGTVTSGGWGHTIGRSIALAFIRNDLAREGQYLQVEILGKRCPAIVAKAMPSTPAAGAIA